MTERQRKMHLKEIHLRGLYLSISCDIEYALTDMACRCLVKDETDRENVKVVFFEKMAMGKKIAIAKKALSQYLPSYDFSTTFILIEKLSGQRNLFAHSKIEDSPSGSEEELLFKYIKDGEEKNNVKNIRELVEFLEKCRIEVLKIMDIVMVVVKKRHWEKFQLGYVLKPLSSYYNIPYCF